MDIAGTQRIPAPRAAVWEALNDPAVLKRCLPGCESAERDGPDAFKVVVAAAVGPLRAKFNGTLRMTQVQPPASCVMIFEGQGGAVGFGQGTASVELREQGSQTDLGYTAQAQVGGKLAQIGSRLIDSVAKKMSDDFFKAFLQQFAPASDAVAAAGAQPVMASTTPAAAASVSDSALPMAAASSAATPAPATASPGRVLVPGWWLLVAALSGSATTLAGALLLR